MPLAITALYGAILGLIVIALAINVTMHRVKLRVPLGGGHLALHIIGIALIAGRVVQTWGMWATDQTNIGRQIGQSLTWLSVAALAVLNLSKLA
ncbi:MAG: MAPEG family protein [Pseudolabrys sp.]